MSVNRLFGCANKVILAGKNCDVILIACDTFDVFCNCQLIFLMRIILGKQALLEAGI